MAEAVLTRRSVVKNEYQKLADITVSGSAVTQVDISGLNIGKGEEITLVCDISHSSSGGVGLLVNTNYTQTNYYTQDCGANSTTVSRSRSNKSMFVYGVNSSSKTLSIIKIKLTNNGYIVYQSESIREYVGTSVALTNFYTTTTFTITSLTSIRILSETSNQIGIGSRFQLYKVGGV